MSISDGMVVVGGGECGARAVLALREAGWSGPVTLVGEEPLAPYERPPLSKSAMTSAEPRPPSTICDPGTLRATGIEFVPGVAATDLDRDTHDLILADGRRIGYQKLLLATGASARRLGLGDGAGDVFYLRSHGDALALRERLVPGARICVIGGGFIGLELAASARIRGCAVTVVETAPRLMSRAVPADVASAIADRHKQAGVQLCCSTEVVELRGQDGIVALQLSSGETLVCDTVVAGVGAVPETTLAAKAGLAVDNGIRTDARLLTSDPDIFAAGDCCSFPHPLYDNQRIRLEAWRNAQDQGQVAARNMLGDDRPFTAVPWFWSDQYDLTLQIAGLPALATSDVVRDRSDGVAIRFGVSDGGRLVAASAVGVGNAVAKDIRLAELLIARRAAPDPAKLADPHVDLKVLLKS